MRFTKIVFTHPRIVFGNTSSGSLETTPNERAPAVESLEERGQWVIVVRDGVTKAIPASAIEYADVLVEAQQQGRK
jgi:hypothetical protein